LKAPPKIDPQASRTPSQQELEALERIEALKLQQIEAQSRAAEEHRKAEEAKLAQAKIIAENAAEARKEAAAIARQKKESNGGGAMTAGYQMGERLMGDAAGERRGKLRPTDPIEANLGESWIPGRLTRNWSVNATFARDRRVLAPKIGGRYVLVIEGDTAFDGMPVQLLPDGSVKYLNKFGIDPSSGEFGIYVSAGAGENGADVPKFVPQDSDGRYTILVQSSMGAMKSAKFARVTSENGKIKLVPGVLIGENAVTHLGALGLK
jgi:hypothetical protein